MFTWSDEHKMIRKMVRRWATDRLEPKVTAFENGEPPYELMREFARTFGLADMVKAAFAKEGTITAASSSSIAATTSTATLARSTPISASAATSVSNWCLHRRLKRCIRSRRCARSRSSG